MQDSYKSAMNKISSDPAFEEQLKARLKREQARIDRAPSAPHSPRQFRMLMSVATAAVLLLTVISASIAVPRFLERSETGVTDPDTSAVDTPVTDTTELAEIRSGYNAITLAQDLSFRYVSQETAVSYDTNIYFRFEGFDKYDIELRETCIVFVTDLDPSYTLANFFDDYYKLIVNGNGISKINNGVLEAMFDIGENGLRTISIHDEDREIIDLDTVLMSEYSDMDNIYFTVSIT